MQPLAITGVGVVSPLGVGREAFTTALGDWEQARATAFAGDGPLEGERYQDVPLAAVRDFDATAYLGKKGLRNFDRLTRMLIVAARHALQDAGVKRDGEFVALDPMRVGLCSATAYGSLDSITEINRVAELEHPRFLNPSRFPNTVINSAAGYVAIWEGLRAPNVTVVDGNCGALDALLTAQTHLDNGRASAFLVGGGEVISEPLYLAFDKLGVHRSGVRLGEGAAYCLVEPVAQAQERGADVQARVLGYGTAFEPPPSEGRLLFASAEAVQRAIAMALRDAGLSAADVDLVCSARSGLPWLDRAETDAVAAAFGADVAVVEPKQMWGETHGASGALAMVATTAWLSGVPAAPLSGAAPKKCETALVLTVGYYGNVSAAVLAGP